MLLYVGKVEQFIYFIYGVMGFGNEGISINLGIGKMGI